MTTQPPLESVEAVLAAHAWGDDTAQVGHHAVQCVCGWKDYEPSRNIYALRSRHDRHRAAALREAGLTGEAGETVTEGSTLHCPECEHVGEWQCPACGALVEAWQQMTSSAQPSGSTSAVEALAEVWEGLATDTAWAAQYRTTWLSCAGQLRAALAEDEA